MVVVGPGLVKLIGIEFQWIEGGKMYTSRIEGMGWRLGVKEERVGRREKEQAANSYLLFYATEKALKKHMLVLWTPLVLFSGACA